MGEEKENNFVDDGLRDMEVSFSVSLKTGNCVESHAIFLNELQAFLDKRARSATSLTAQLCNRGRPPKGLKPRFIFLEERLDDLKQAINRYIEVNQKVPINWIEEYNVICSELNSGMTVTTDDEVVVRIEIDGEVIAKKVMKYTAQELLNLQNKRL